MLALAPLDGAYGGGSSYSNHTSYSNRYSNHTSYSNRYSNHICHILMLMCILPKYHFEKLAVHACGQRARIDSFLILIFHKEGI